jgi:hypothetical protein
VRGGNEGSEHAVLISVLAERVATLAEGEAFVVAELSTDGVKKWKIKREPNGTPKCLHWEPEPWLSLYDNGELDETKLREVVLPSNGAPVLLVQTSVDGPRAGDAYRRLRNDAQVGLAVACPDSLETSIGRILIDDPLTQFYELVVVSLSKSGRCELSAYQLFRPDSVRGDRVRVRVRCEPSGELGTAFAIASRGRSGSFHLVSITLIKIIPGIYDITAELRGAGRVRFTGLDGDVLSERRRWSELIGSLPARLKLVPRGHLVCLVETSGAAEAVADRLDRVEQLVEVLPGAAVSLITYGPHAVGRDYKDGPLTVLAWAESTSKVLGHVQELRELAPMPTGYPPAAQVECALTEVADLLARKEKETAWLDRRLAVVTIGARPAFPPRRDLSPPHIIPCPARHDWRSALMRISKYPPGVAFGAIVDQDTQHVIWERLGHDALAVAGSVFDARSFAGRLGLIDPGADPVPLPLLVDEGS